LIIYQKMKKIRAGQEDNKTIYLPLDDLELDLGNMTAKNLGNPQLVYKLIKGIYNVRTRGERSMKGLDPIF